MFENFESGTSKSRAPLWARIRAVTLGIAYFFPAFFLSLLATIPWSKHYWAGDGQAVLGGVAVSFWFGIAFAIAASVYLLKRAIPTNQRQGTRGQ